MATVTAVRLRFLLANGRRARPKWFFGEDVTDVAVPEADLQDLADAARATVVSADLMAGFDDTVIFEEAEAQNFTRIGAGTTADPYRWEATTITYESSGADVPGTQTVDSAPPQIAPIWSVKSSLPGPSGRNRTYLPPIPDTEVNALGAIDSTRSAQLTADITAIIDAIETAAPVGYTQVVALPFVNQLRPVVSQQLQPIVGTQRPRRKA